MNDKTKENKKEKDLDENELAKSVIDEIIEETESENSDKEKSLEQPVVRHQTKC